jgi:Tfp pilus assembly protein PilO
MIFECLLLTVSIIALAWLFFRKKAREFYHSTDGKKEEMNAPA